MFNDRQKSPAVTANCVIFETDTAAHFWTVFHYYDNISTTIDFCVDIINKLQPFPPLKQLRVQSHQFEIFLTDIFQAPVSTNCVICRWTNSIHRTSLI